MNLISCAILAAIVTGAFLFVLASFRLARIADDTAEQIARQIAEGQRPASPTINQPRGD